jgi:hypothetical protein
MERLTGLSAADTSTTTWFRQVWNECGVHHTAIVVDPFARDCELGHVDFRNDWNPDTSATHHEDALEWMRGLPSGFADFIIFDPPFSERMATDKYDGFGTTNLYTDGKYISALMIECERILLTGGRLLKLGFNSTRHRPTFDLVGHWVVNHGGNRHDTTLTLWRKVVSSLEEWGVPR